MCGSLAAGHTKPRLRPVHVCVSGSPLSLWLWGTLSGEACGWPLRLPVRGLSQITEVLGRVQLCCYWQGQGLGGRSWTPWQGDGRSAPIYVCSCGAKPGNLPLGEAVPPGTGGPGRLLRGGELPYGWRKTGGGKPRPIGWHTLGGGWTGLVRHLCSKLVIK